MPDPFNLGNQFMPGYNAPQAPMPMGHYEQMMAMLNARYNPARHSSNSFAHPTLQNQIITALSGFGEFGQALAPIANQWAARALGIGSTAQLAPFGSNYNPGQLL